MSDLIRTPSTNYDIGFLRPIFEALRADLNRKKKSGEEIGKELCAYMESFGIDLYADKIYIFTHLNMEDLI